MEPEKGKALLRIIQGGAPAPKGVRDFLAAHRRPLPRRSTQGVQAFLAGHPGVVGRLPRGTHDAYVRICAMAGHLRSREATAFWIQTLQEFERLAAHPLRRAILSGAVTLSCRNWAMVQPFFRAVHSLPSNEETLEEGILLALRLADWDMDAGLTFLNQTPQAVAAVGVEDLFVWGELAVQAVQEERRAARAARAYLEEAVSKPDGASLSRWGAWLHQAARVALASEAAAEQFVRRGTQVCAFLSEEEVERWVTAGLAHGTTEVDLLGYFSGTHQRALDVREDVRSGVTLDQRASSLALLCEAFLGRPVAVRSNASVTGVRGFAGGAATDGRSIYLPPVLPNAERFKLVALHQASLLSWWEWCEHAGARAGSYAEIHRRADQILLQRLPGLLAAMGRWGEGLLPASYPDALPQEFHGRLPWWGDLLPQLLHDTQATIERLVAKATAAAELPPATVEAVVASLMSRGRRDEETLWNTLQEVMDNASCASPDPEELEEGFRTFFYREWDEDLHDFKVDWSLVRRRVAREESNPFAQETSDRLQGLITLIRRQFARLKPESLKKFKAQDTGDDLDLEALVTALVDRRSSGFLSDKVYIRRDKRTRDVAVLFLVDMSASTEERVSGKRVIDIQKEAMVLMAEALDSLGDPFAIFGFTSEGRFRVDLLRVKGFEEPYGDRVRHRLGNLEPRHYTRLGAVLRHGTHELDGIGALVKLMVVLTDGRPYDTEYGHLSYAVADTKKALQEARRHGVHPFIITSDKRGAGYLRRICPQTQSIIVPRVESLPMLLPAMYRRLTT